MPLLDQVETTAVTIANGASLSDGANLAGKRPLGIITPAAWDAAAITFEASDDGITYYPFGNTDGELSIASAGVPTAYAAWRALNPADFAAVSFLKVRSGTKAAAVNQTAARTITIITAPLL